MSVYSSFLPEVGADGPRPHPGPPGPEIRVQGTRRGLGESALPSATSDTITGYNPLDSPHP